MAVAAWAQEQRAVVALVVNLVEKGEAIAIIRPNDMLVQVSDLEAAGVKGVAGKRETIGGKVWVSLVSLAPDITYEFDPQTVKLSLTSGVKHLGENTLDLRASRPPEGIVYTTEPSAFFNYSLDVSNFTNYSFLGEVGISMFGSALLDGTFSGNAGAAGTTLVRGYTSLTIDDRADTRRLILGDFIATAPQDPLGGSAILGGINLIKNFALDPYFVRTPSQTMSGAVTVPSTADVYVNGRLVSTQQLPPGLFTLQNIPLLSGAGNTQVVIHNPLGGSQVMTMPYYVNTAGLAQGVSDYTYSVGSVRQGLGTESFGYRGLDFQGGERYGLTNWLTPGFRLEGRAGLINGGATLITATPLGGVALSGALSDSGGEKGQALSLTYGYAGGYTGHITAAAQAEWMGPHYSNLSLPPSANRPLFSVDTSISIPAGQLISLSPAFHYGKLRDGGYDESFSLTASAHLWDGLTLVLSGIKQAVPLISRSTVLFATLIYTFPKANVVIASYGHQDGGEPDQRGNLEQIEFEKAQPYGTGYGYLFDAQQGQGSQVFLTDLTDRGEHGFYEYRFNHTNSIETQDLILSGALVALGGRIMAGPPVQDAFAVIRTEGVPDVEGLASHNSVGVTDSRGDLLLPNLISNFGNPISINEREVPINYKVEASEAIIAPPYRGGALISFPIRPIRAFTGTLEVEFAGRPTIPAYGQLRMTAEGKEFLSPIGKDGAFYLDSPPPGRFPATVDFDAGVCAFAINIPGGKEPFVKLGTLTCTM